MKTPVEFYFGNTDWEIQNSDKYSSEWNRLKKELDQIKSIWENNTTKEFPNLRFIIGDNFKNYRSRLKTYIQTKGKYPFRDNWQQRNLPNGLKKVERPIMIGNDGLGKLHEWHDVCQDKYPDNTILISSSWIKQYFKSYGFIRDRAKENTWDAYKDYIYTKQYVYHIFGHMIKLREMKSCPIMNRYKYRWQLGASRTQHIMGLDTETTLNKRLAFYIKRKYK